MRTENSLLGSIFIVSGTAVGAGMLAMPLVLADSGWWASILMLVAFWALTCYSALLYLRVYEQESADSGFSTITLKYLGKAWDGVLILALLFLLYSLTAAYVTGGGEVIQLALNRNFTSLATQPWLGSLLFTVIGGIIILLGTSAVIRVNKVFFVLKIILFGTLLGLMFPLIDLHNYHPLPRENYLLWSAIPVIFTAFGFHGSIPTLIRHNQNQPRRLRYIILIGSALPLIIYSLWLVATLGILNTESVKTPSLEMLIQSIEQTSHTLPVRTTFDIFANIALATSFLGVTLGLFDYLIDLIKLKRNFSGHSLAVVLTFVPPFLFAILYPHGFVIALGYAAIPLAFIAIILPAMLLIAKRRQTSSACHGWSTGTIICLLAGFGIIVVQILLASGILAHK